MASRWLKRKISPFTAAVVLLLAVSLFLFATMGDQVLAAVGDGIASIRGIALRIRVGNPRPVKKVKKRKQMNRASPSPETTQNVIDRLFDWKF